VEGKVFVNAAMASNEVIFEGENSALGSVAAMGAGWHELIINFFFLHEFFECIGTFIVKTLKLGFQAGRMAEFGVDGLALGTKDGLGASRLHRFGHALIAIVII
jgi:hypothetical protein